MSINRSDARASGNINTRASGNLVTEIEYWRNKYYQIEAEHIKCPGSEIRLLSCEKRIEHLRTEVQRLNSEMREDLDELEDKRLEKLEVEIENHDLKMSKLQLKRLGEILAERTAELEKSRRRALDLEIQVIKLRYADEHVQDLEAIIRQLTEELNMWKLKYQQGIEAQNSLIERIKQTYSDTEKFNVNQLIHSLENTYQEQITEAKIIKVDNMRFKLQQQESIKKIQELEVQQNEFNSKKQDYEDQINSLKQMNQEFQNLIKEKINENETLRMDLTRATRAGTKNGKIEEN